jgi:hypothetical protein
MSFRVRAVVLASLTLPCAARAASQSCAAPPSYGEVMNAVATLPGLDTIPIRGVLSVAVIVTSDAPMRAELGTPAWDSPDTIPETCRIPLLWTSRGDSVVVTWITNPHPSRVVPEGLPTDTSLQSRPRPVYHTQRPVARSTTTLDSLLTAAYARSGTSGARNRSTFYVLIDSLGRLSVARIARSSGVRALDEAGLEALLTLTFEPVLVDSQPVAAWFLLPVSWQTYRAPRQRPGRTQHGTAVCDVPRRDPSCELPRPPGCFGMAASAICSR